MNELGNRSAPSMFIEYAEGIKAFQHVDEEIHSVVVCKDVVFDETAEWSAVPNFSRKLVTPDRHKIDLELHLIAKVLSLRTMRLRPDRYSQATRALHN